MPKGETSRPYTKLDKSLPKGENTADVGRQIRETGAKLEKGLGKDYTPYRKTTKK